MDSVNPDPSNVPDDDLTLQNYQDDVDTSSSISDPVMDFGTDRPAEELGVDEKEFKNELDKYDFDEAGHGNDDRREQMEDLDQEVQPDISK